MASEGGPVYRGVLRAIQTGEVRLVFQPQVSLVDRRVRGFEALVRWDHPEAGTLGGSAVVASALAEGEYQALSWSVFKAAMEAAASWPCDTTVSVNVMVGQRPVKDIHLSLLYFATMAGVQPSRVVVELTEAAPVPLTAENVAAFEAMAQDGFRLALDDFGRGYSTVELLARLPVQTVKIDRQFVSSMDDGRVAQVVRGMVAMASHAGADCVAEGVEDRHQAARLASAGCVAAQGFLYSPGLSARAAAGWSIPEIGVDEPPFSSCGPDAELVRGAL